MSERTCRGCDLPIVSGRSERNPRQWCSERCRVKFWRTANKDKAAAIQARQLAKHNERSAIRQASTSSQRCPMCGDDYAPLRGRKYCSRKCAGLSAAYRRRALTNDVVFSTGERYSVFERDGWVCGICQHPIDADLRWPEHGAATLDHVTPLSVGGLHELENLQAAHFSCNSSKSNRVEVSDGNSRASAKAKRGLEGASL